MQSQEENKEGKDQDKASNERSVAATDQEAVRKSGTVYIVSGSQFLQHIHE